VDGFDQAEAAGGRDERGVVLGGFFAPERTALEALELAHGLLDPSAAPMEGLGKEGRAISGGGATRDCGAAREYRADVPLPRGLTVWRGIVPLVGRRRPGRDVWADIEQDVKLPAVAGCAPRPRPRQMAGGGQAVKLGLEADPG
jgi:hypothetical protein